MPNMISKQAAPSPRHIAVGLGDASRQEICGLLALLDAARLSKIAGAVGEAARRKLVSDDKQDADRVTAFAEELMDGPLLTDALRSRLWLGVARRSVPTRYGRISWARWWPNRRTLPRTIPTLTRLNRRTLRACDARCTGATMRSVVSPSDSTGTVNRLSGAIRAKRTADESPVGCRRRGASRPARSEEPRRATETLWSAAKKCPRSLMTLLGAWGSKARAPRRVRVSRLRSGWSGEARGSMRCDDARHIASRCTGERYGAHERKELK